MKPFFLAVLVLVVAAAAAEGVEGAQVHRLECPGCIDPLVPGTRRSSSVTLNNKVAYVTAETDMRVNAVLCEKAEKKGVRKLCFPMSCEVSAGAICAIQSPNEVDFDHTDSACVQSATALDYTKWLNRQRHGYYVLETPGASERELNEPSWVEHCVCSISTRNWFLNARAETNETSVPDAVGPEEDDVDKYY